MTLRTQRAIAYLRDWWGYLSWRWDEFSFRLEDRRYRRCERRGGHEWGPVRLSVPYEDAAPQQSRYCSRCNWTVYDPKEWS